MHTQEKQKSSFYENPAHEISGSHERDKDQVDYLRQSLLAAPEARGGFVAVPLDTVTVRMNSDLLIEGGMADLSGMVDIIQEQKIRGEGTGLLSSDQYLGALDQRLKEERKQGETAANITFLYEKGSHKTEEEIHIPSAVIVHEVLTEERLRELREQLPEGVPILDGETNALLDEVGSKEREKERENLRLNRLFGNIAVESTIDSTAWFSSAYARQERIDSTRTIWASKATSRQSYDRSNEDHYESRQRWSEDVFRDRQSFGNGYSTSDSPFTSEAYTEMFDEMTRRGKNTPESEEVRAYRLKQEAAKAYDEARAEDKQRTLSKAIGKIEEYANDLFGISSLDNLNAKQVAQVKRRLYKENHHDANLNMTNGQREIIDQASKLLDQARRKKEGATTPAPEATSTPEGTPSEAPPHTETEATSSAESEPQAVSPRAIEAAPAHTPVSASLAPSAIEK